MSLILENLKQKKFLIQSLIFFSLFIIIFFILDYLNMSYTEMSNTYGIYLVLINIFLNIIMAILSAVLLISSEIMIKGTKSSNLGFIAIIFGMFTYGCTTCLIAFFANLGIILSIMVLPFAGLPYKLISLVLIIIGSIITIRKINKGCIIKTTEK
ncbi:MAG: hypothetical protein M0Q88_04525 [Bacilli bacterium]|nr:hypothetical protein [Bacilli bacterium]